MISHNCYACKNHSGVPGSAHSTCNVRDMTNREKILTSMFVSNGLQFKEITFNPHGVRMGWCAWPLDFDPVWIEKCEFYEEKK